MLLKKCVYDELVKNIHTININIPNAVLFSKKQYDLDKKNIEQKIENVDKKNTWYQYIYWDPRSW